MNYLVKLAIEKSSCAAVLMVIKFSSNNKLRGLSLNRPGEKECFNAFVKSGKTSNLTENVRNKIKEYISKKLEVNDECLEQIMTRDTLPYSMKDIDEERQKSRLTVLEIGGSMGINQNTFYHMYKRKLPLGLDEITMKLIQTVGEKKTKKHTAVNLMRSRVNEGYSLEEAASYIKISAKNLWNYEWLNSVPIDLVEKIAEFYRIDQETIPISFKEEMNYRHVLSLVRKNYGMTLSEISEKTGYSKGRCSAFENDENTAPPYEYVKDLLTLATENESTVEGVLLNAMKSDIKTISVPYETIEYYRKVYYNNEEKDWDKNKGKTPKGQKVFQKEIGITPADYRRGIWTIKQVKKAIQVLKIEIKYTNLMMPLTNKQKKIMNEEIDVEKLINGRKKKNLSISMASRITGVGYSTIAAIECKKYSCTPEILKRLADCYNMRPEDFV